jgi:hypothetical protein
MEISMSRIAAISLIIFITLTTPCLSETFKATGTIDAYFSQRGGSTEAIVKEFISAKSILKSNKPLIDRYIGNVEEHKGHSE